MRRFIAIITIFLLLTVYTVQATTLSAVLPGGINYLDEENMSINGSLLSTMDSIRVKPHTDYVLWIPPEVVVPDAYILITNQMEELVDESILSGDKCITDSDETYCVFNTGDSDFLDIYIESNDLIQFINFYGFVDIQLEEGTIPTAYESYIAPDISDVTSPEFSGTGLFVKAYYEEIALQDIIDNYIIAYDDIDGDITSSIIATTDQYTANAQVVGEYVVVLEASDSSGNSSSFQLTIIVQDVMDPVIDGPPTIEINVNNPMVLTDILYTYYTFTDGYDGTLLPTVVSDDYTGNETIIGDYNVVVAVQDSSDNVSSITIPISVVDTTAPTLESSTSITTNVSAESSLSVLLNSLTWVDNYDSLNNLSLTVTQDNYSGNENVVGVYDVVVEVRDSSGNTTIKTITITVFDDVAPLIKGSEEITVSYVEAPPLSDVIATLTVLDNSSSLSNDDLVIIVDEYSVRNAIIGDFTITVEVTDGGGNTTSHTIIMHIIDDVAPHIFVDDFLITVTPQALFQPRDALHMLIERDLLPDQDYDVITIKDEYTGNETTPGTYQYTVNYIDENGIEYLKDFTIKVTGKAPVSYRDIIESTVAYGGVVAMSVFVYKRMKK